MSVEYDNLASSFPCKSVQTFRQIKFLASVKVLIKPTDLSERCCFNEDK